MKDENLSSLYQSAMENSKYLKFILNSDKKEQCFYLDKNLSKDDENINFAKSFSGYTSNIYNEKKSEFFYQIYEDIFLGDFVIKKKKEKIKWELINETKMISGYLCYKAIYNEKTINQKGEFTHQVIAWYSPLIPLPYGPIGYGDLPGLILELNKKNVVFGASIIELNPKKNLKIIKPNLKSVKTEEEINKLREDFINSKED